MATQQTAREAYEQYRQDIARVMDWIGLELDKIDVDAKASPKDWSHAGALQTARHKLIESLAFLSNSEPQEIEDLLGECR
jgi:hypothetical protein